MRIIAIILSCLAVVFLSAPAQGRITLTTFDLEAHRGGRDLWPENTLAAFRNALEMGVTTLEMDAQLTKDGVPVLCHNPVLSGTIVKDRRGRWIPEGSESVVHRLTLAEVKRYDVGAINPEAKEYWEAHGKLQKSVPGERIPTLEEVFRLVESMGNRRVLFNIETKSFADRPDHELNPDPDTFVRALLKVINKYRMEDRVMIQSFDWRTLLEVRRLAPSMTTVALTAEVPAWGSEGLYRLHGQVGPSPWMAGFDIDDFAGDYVKAAKAVMADVVSPYFREIAKPLVEEAHGLGMKVVPWTVNAREDMEKMIDMGVDGIITDRPDILKKTLEERGIAY
jgi:glycerophosphoryl diester phosphodiesterase